MGVEWGWGLRVDGGRVGGYVGVVELGVVVVLGGGGVV